MWGRVHQVTSQIRPDGAERSHVKVPSSSTTGVDAAWGIQRQVERREDKP